MLSRRTLLIPAASSLKFSQSTSGSSPPLCYSGDRNLCRFHWSFSNSNFSPSSVSCSSPTSFSMLLNCSGAVLSSSSISIIVRPLPLPSRAFFFVLQRPRDFRKKNPKPRYLGQIFVPWAAKRHGRRRLRARSRTSPQHKLFRRIETLRPVASYTVYDPTTLFPSSVMAVRRPPRQLRFIHPSLFAWCKDSDSSCDSNRIPARPTHGKVKRVLAFVGQIDPDQHQFYCVLHVVLH